MKKAAVYTRDLLLYRRLLLWFGEKYAVSLSEDGNRLGEDIAIVDADFFPKLSGDVVLSRVGLAGAMAIPFSIEDMENALQSLEKRDTGRLCLVEGERAVRLDGATVRLTDVEYRLLRVLLSVPVGEYVSKQKIVTEVWGDGVDGGVVNVYVHYLREKLEKNGERIILSSRNLGYKINERTVTVC